MGVSVCMICSYSWGNLHYRSYRCKNCDSFVCEDCSGQKLMLGIVLIYNTISIT